MTVSLFLAGDRFLGFHGARVGSEGRQPVPHLQGAGGTQWQRSRRHLLQGWHAGRLSDVFTLCVHVYKWVHVYKCVHMYKCVSVYKCVYGDGCVACAQVYKCVHVYTYVHVYKCA